MKRKFTYKLLSVALAFSLLYSILPSNVLAQALNGVQTITLQDSTKQTPEATATPTPESTATPTPEQTATPTPEQTATPTPEQTATPTPEQTATPTPIMAMVPRALVVTGESYSYPAGNEATLQVTISSADVSQGIIVPGSSVDGNITSRETWNFTAQPNTGYIFDHWDITQNQGVDNLEDDSATLTFRCKKDSGLDDKDNYRFTAVAYFKVAPTYTVTYNANGGTGSVPTDSAAYASGASVTVLGNTGGLTRTNYTFVGWANNANNNSDDVYGPGTTFTISGNKTLYAKWISNTTTFNHIDVEVAGTLSIDHKINGVSQPGYPQTLSVTVSNVSGSYVDLSGTHIADDFAIISSTEYRDNLTMTWPSSITINATLTGGGHSYPINNYTITGNAILAAFNLCPGSVGSTKGFDIEINASELTNEITHSVTFETTTGGTIGGGTSDIEHTGILEGSSCPTPPAAAANSGYQFLGWTKNSDTTLYSAAQVDAMTITADTTFTAQFGAEFRVRNNNGPGGDHGSVQVLYNGISDNLDYGEEITFAYYAPAGDVSLDFVPDAGYAFLYYVIGNGATHISDDPDYIDPDTYAGQPGANNRIDVNPKWVTAVAYTLLYDANGGTGAPTDPASPYNGGEDVTILNGTPTWAGHTFNGWTSSAFAGTQNAGFTFTMPEVNVTLYADWTTNAYDVTWNNYDNSELEKDLDVLYGATPLFNGTTPLKPATAQYTYTFNGWSPAVSPVTGDITYTAQFTETTNAYDVTWNNYDNSELEKDLDVLYGATPLFNGTTPLKPATAQYTYTFNGWSPAVSPVTGDITYTAQFTETTNAYDVTWNNYDNSELEKDLDVLYGATPLFNGTTPLKPATAQYTYTFNGWSPAVSPVTGDITYTAQFTETTNAYDVTWNNYDNSELEKDLDVLYGATPLFNGTTPLKPATAQYTYTFNGWSPAVSPVTGDITYTAQFTETTNAYDVTWNNYDNSELEKDLDVLYGATPLFNGTTPLKPATAQYTYTFNGWSPAVSPVTGDITYTAQFTETTNAYDVTWNNYDNSELEKDLDVLYGATPLFNGTTPLKPATAQYTYTFNGWSPAVSPVTGDITYTAQFTETTNAFAVTFVSVGSGHLDGTATFNNIEHGTAWNNAWVPTPVPNSDAYFVGWTPSFPTNVTDNLTFTATFAQKTAITLTANSATVTYDGTEHSVTGFSGLPAGLTVNGVSASGKGTNAGNYNVTFTTGTVQILDGAADVTDHYMISYTDGKLTVNPKAVTITVANKTKTQGNNDPLLTAGVTGLVGGDTLAYTLSRVAGGAVGTYTITASYTPNANYAVTVVNGVLTINAAPVNPTATPLNPTPTTTTIVNPDVPAGGPVGASWALLNLLLTIATALASIGLLIGYFRKKQQEDGSESDQKRKGFMRIFSLVPGIGAIVAFILTENMRNPMIFVDMWTLLMIGIAAVQAVVMYLARKNSEDVDKVQIRKAY